MTTLAAGTCATCQAEVWIFVSRPGDEHRIPIFPKGDSVYARVLTPHGRDVGIAFCPEHAPPRGAVWGDGIVESLETAAERYGAKCYTSAFGVWLATHAADEWKLSEIEALKLLERWNLERTEVA